MIIKCLSTGEVVHSYSDYLRSEHWRLMRARMRKVKVNQFCFICRTPDKLQIHHRTYDTLGNEHTHDLMFLCDECHNAVHERVNNPTYKREQLYNAARILRRERKQ